MIDLSSHKKRNVLVVDSNIRDINTANGRAVNELIIALNDINFNVIAAATFEDGAATVISDSSLCCIFVDWTSGGNDDESHSQAFALLQDIRRRNKSVPVLLMAEHSCINSLSLETMQLVNELFGCMKIPPSLSLLVPKHSSSSITSSCCRLLRKRCFNIRKIILNIHGLPPVIKGALPSVRRRLDASFLISLARIYFVRILVLNVSHWDLYWITVGR